ncbi:MAG TPA: type II secretion system protein N [Usitatibacter sp.]|jgi:general secretion pathway protein C|nr:type II secretion system protein N [Usitatibacter sp.]
MSTLPAPARNRSLDALLVAALVVVLAWQLAYWTWRFAIPPANASAATAAPGGVDLDLVARLFGASHAAPASNASLRLKGVVAPTPGTVAAAIFGMPAGRDIAVLPGGEVGGVKLAEVHPDHVIVTRAGVRERIDLDTPHNAKAATANTASSRGFHLEVARTGQNDFSFVRRDLDTALRDPNQLNYLGQIGMPPGGGVRMDAAPPGSLASKLGLQAGDVIRRVNGQPIASSGDLARLYQQFATLNTVQAEVERGGQVVRLSYRIQ